MTGSFADRLFRITFAVAGVYNLAFGLWAALWPLAFFQLFEIAQPRYPSIWASVGMIVGVYALLYWYSAWRLDSAWPIIAVGLLGKVLGPIGMVMSFGPDWPRRMGMLCVFNDAIWWLPFGLFLVRGTWFGKRLTALAPWICVGVHLAALAMLGLYLHAGTLIVSDPAARAQHVANHPIAWAIGWSMWMAAAASLVGFYAWWGGHLDEANATAAPPKRRQVATWVVVAVVVTALGMVCDFCGEGSAILRMPEHVPLVADSALPAQWNEIRFVGVERQFTLLSAGAANALYTIGGAILTLLTPNLPMWIRRSMWVTWAAAAAMTVTAVVGSVVGMVVTSVFVFPLLLGWVAWMGARWQPDSINSSKSPR